MASNRRRGRRGGSCGQHRSLDPRHEQGSQAGEARSPGVRGRAREGGIVGKAPGAHKIEGIGIGFLPPLWKPDEVDGIIPVSTEEAKTTARRLAREEAIFAGTSTGANIAAALKVARRLGAGATVATVIVDSGLRYLSTDVFATA